MHLEERLSSTTLLNTNVVANQESNWSDLMDEVDSYHHLKASLPDILVKLEMVLEVIPNLE